MEEKAKLEKVIGEADDCDEEYGNFDAIENDEKRSKKGSQPESEHEGCDQNGCQADTPDG
jgi:hypothetical protein